METSIKLASCNNCGRYYHFKVLRLLRLIHVHHFSTFCSLRYTRYIYVIMFWFRCHFSVITTFSLRQRFATNRPPATVTLFGNWCIDRTVRYSSDQCSDQWRHSMGDESEWIKLPADQKVEHKVRGWYNDMVCIVGCPPSVPGAVVACV